MPWYAPDKWNGNSLSEIYSYLKDGDGKYLSNSIDVELVNTEECKKFIHIKYYLKQKYINYSIYKKENYFV